MLSRASQNLSNKVLNEKAPDFRALNIYHFIGFNIVDLKGCYSILCLLVLLGYTLSIQSTEHFMCHALCT